jgi:hypothetical protein
MRPGSPPSQGQASRGRLEGLPAASAAAGATLVALESLWAFHDAVKASGLTFSMIRMRNAAAAVT